jgi:hypothetical protein
VTEIENKIPIILLHKNSTSAYSIFNCNDWGSKSKQIVDLCAINYGLIFYTSKKINKIYEEAHILCSPSFNNIRLQWRKAKWELNNCNYFVDVPQLHLSIHSFLSSVKTFLDVIVQLIATEGVVSAAIHGFHKENNIIGGRLLKILENNAEKNNKEKAKTIYDLIVRHKQLWIDDAVNNRDLLIHPEGFSKIMFNFILSEKKGNLKLDEIIKPSIGDLAFNKYALDTLLHVESFSREIIKCLKNSCYETQL